jgi:hypothetical protein
MTSLAVPQIPTFVRVGLSPERSRAAVMKRRSWVAGAWLYAFALVAFLLTSNGHFQSTDEFAMSEVAQNIAYHADFAVTDWDFPDWYAGDRGTDGRLYAKYGLGYSLVGSAVYRAAAALPPPLDRPRVRVLAYMLLGPLVGAGLVCATFGAALRLGARPAVGLYLAAALGFGTTVWVYARAAFSDPLLALLLLLCVVTVPTAETTPWRRFWQRSLLAGLLFGYAALTKQVALAWAPAIPLGLLLGRRLGLRRTAAATALFAAGMLPCLALAGWYNWVRFGSPLSSGYSAEHALTFDAAVPGRLAALLASPSRGVFWFAPVVLFLCAGAVVAAVRARYRAQPRPALQAHRQSQDWPSGDWSEWRALAPTLLLTAGAILLTHAGYVYWYGGESWGPRLLLPLLPLVLLLTVPFVEWLAGCGRRGWAVLLVVLAVSALPQLLAMAVNWLPSVSDKDLFVWAASPLVKQAAAVWATARGTSSAAQVDLVWVRSGGPLARLALVGAAAVGTATLVLLWRETWRSARALRASG